MDSILRINDLLKDTGSGIIERVLWIDVSRTCCYCIEMETKRLRINVRDLGDIDKGFEDGTYTIIQSDDSSKILREINESRKERLENRYNVVNEIDNDENVPACFIRKYRGKLVKNAIDKYRLPEKTVYDWLRRYWQGGRTIEALLENYDNCGKCPDKKYKKKPGRESAAAKSIKNYVGVITDDEVKSIFYDGYIRYCKNNENMTLSETFYNIIADDFRDKLWYEKPTLDQFYYWYRVNMDKNDKEKNQKGEKNYNNNVRPLPSDTVYESFGAGFRYMVDSTIFPIYLVNRIDRSLPCGKPTVYFCVDVFSTRVTGIHIDFHGDSWDGYASLLYNTFQPKDKYCNAFGINISNNEWNISGLSKVVFGDRGGFMNKNSHILIKNLHVAFENAPSYTGSAKGTVEKKFDIIEKMIKNDLPGIIMTKYRERGQRDYRKDAKMDIYEFTQIVIDAVLERNALIMDNYPLEKELVWAGVYPSANAIWDWSIKNKTGYLGRVSEDKLRYYLLRHANASTTPEGIKYRNMLYTCDIAEKENWFSRLNKSKKIEIAFDSRCLNTIMMYDSSTEKCIECQINRQKTSNDIYIDRTLEEIVQYDDDVLVKKGTIYRDMNDKVFAEKRDKRIKIAKESIKKSEGNVIKVDDIEAGREIEKALSDGKNALIKKPYKEGEGINEENFKNEVDNQQNKDKQSDFQQDLRKSMAEFLRNKLINNKN